MVYIKFDIFLNMLITLFIKLATEDFPEHSPPKIIIAFYIYKFGLLAHSSNEDLFYINLL